MQTLSRILAALMLVLALTGCQKSKTTDTQSDAFATIQEKQEFLERYVTFRRSYDELHFSIRFIDGSGGMVPAPSDWSIAICATVPATEIAQWTDGLETSGTPETDWVDTIPNAPTDLAGFTWYHDKDRVVGVDHDNRLILYHNSSRPVVMTSPEPTDDSATVTP